MSIEFSEKYYTTKEAATLLKIKQDTLKRYCNQTPQRIRGEKIGSSWMIPRSAIREYLKAESERGRPKNSRNSA